HLSNGMRECLALNVMYLIARDYRDARPMSFDRLAEQLRIPAIALTPVVNSLESAGLILATEREGLVPGRDMGRIRLSEILDVVRRHGETGSYRGPRWFPGIAELGQQLEQAVAGVVGERTLADLVDELSRRKGESWKVRRPRSSSPRRAASRSGWSRAGPGRGRSPRCAGRAPSGCRRS